LSSDSNIATSFYLQGAYDTAVAEALQAGSDSVTNSPNTYNLTSSFAYDAVVAQRDARPTIVAYNTVLAERDARFVDTDEDGLTDMKELGLGTGLTVATSFYLQGAYDNAVAASKLEGRQAGRTDVTGTPGSFNLTTVESYNTVLAERDARFVDTDEDGLTNVKEIELATDSAVATSFYLQGAYDNAVEASNLLGRQAGRTEVTANPGVFNLTTVAAYNTVLAERDARFVDTDEDGLTNVKEIELATDSAVATSFYLQGAYDDAVVASELLGRQAGQSEVTANPGGFNLTTVAAYNTVIAERDARFTEDQIRTMSVDHTVGQNEAGNMQVEIAFIQSADLNNYIPFTVPPDSLSVVDGKICMEFPPSDEQNFFFRFRLE